MATHVQRSFAIRDDIPAMFTTSAFVQCGRLLLALAVLNAMALAQVPATTCRLLAALKLHFPSFPG